MAERRTDIDALRVGATLLLVVFHSAMVFNQSTAWHIQDEQRSELAASFVSFVHVWHMPLFFFLAGMSAWFAFSRRSAAQFRRERVARLLLPLVVGLLVVVPPQVYIERISTSITTRSSPIDFSGSFLAWYPNTFQCCYPEGNLSWHHLWFLAYLFVYSLLAAGAFAAVRRRGLRLPGWATRAGMVTLLPALYLGVAELLLRPSFPNHQDLVGDWANHANYLAVFALGFLIASDERCMAVVRRWWAPSLAAGAGLAIALGLDFGTVAFRGIAEWLMLLGLLGAADRFVLALPGWVERLSSLSLPFYIWHQTVIVLLAYPVLRWEVPIAAKFVVLVTTAGIGSWAMAEVSARVGVLRPLWGLKRAARTGDRVR